MYPAASSDRIQRTTLLLMGLRRRRTQLFCAGRAQRNMHPAASADQAERASVVLPSCVVEGSHASATTSIHSHHTAPAPQGNGQMAHSAVQAACCAGTTAADALMCTVCSPCWECQCSEGHAVHVQVQLYMVPARTDTAASATGQRRL